jgi:heme exporter protein D
MVLLWLFPAIYVLVIVGLLYLFFKILDGIRKSNYERNDILRGIHDELKRQNIQKD